MILAILPIVKFSIIIGLLAIYGFGFWAAALMVDVMYRNTRFSGRTLKQYVCIIIWPILFACLLVYLAQFWFRRLITGKDPYNFRW